MGDRDRAAHDLNLLAGAPRDVVGEKELRGKRRRQPIRETEMGIGLDERRRDPAEAGGEHHWARDVTAGAEDDVGLPSLQDRPAGERCLACTPERAEECDRRRPREAADRERVELEACLRNQLRLDAVGTAGERHGRSAGAQRFPDRERGPDVTCGPSRRDHDYELRRLGHSQRC